MKLVQRMFFELWASSFLIILMDALLTGMFFFAFFYLIFTFFKIYYIYAFAFSSLFFLISFIKKLRRNKILEVEQRYPDLKEKLRTSKDYEKKENLVVLALHTEVLNQVKEVDVNAFLNIKKSFLKVGGTCMILFLILFISSVDFDFFDITTAVATQTAPIVNRIKSRIVPDKIEVGETQDFMEDGTLADLGDEQLNLSLDVYNTGLDLDQIEEGKKNDFGGAFPDETGAVAQEHYNEIISEEYKETIKDYFNKINKVEK